MNAPLTSPSSIRTANNTATLKPHSEGQVKKKRIVRRRGRIQGDLGSDDEIEREYGTDSESEDELSSIDSASDSDTEPASEDVIPNGHVRSFTPSTSQSPGDRGVREKESVNGPFFASAGNWSEMVADENAHGPAALPVIEFADFEGQASVPTVPQPRKASKAKKPAKTARPAPEAAAAPASQHAPGEVDSNETRESEQVASTSRHPSNPPFERRPAGQTPRQAYQQRLESDPSYVPTVGGFWGHDDRLLDKDLRSLSGWWRGRWQGRGRGRGFIRGGGRGGFFGPQSSHPNGDGQFDEAGLGNTHDVPPIERAWTHDGFEELKKKEEQRRAVQRAAPQDQGFQTAGSFRGGRGGGATRGGRGGFSRGGFVASPGRNSYANSGRVWYPVKPELMWTKQHEGFLYFELEPALKPRHGQGPGIVVKLPGKQSQPQVIRASRSYPIVRVITTKTATTSVLGSDLGDRTYLVRLPKRSGKEKAVEPPVTQDETPIEEVFTVRPSLVERKPIPLPKRAATINGILKSPSAPSDDAHTNSSIAPSPQSRPESFIRSQLEHLSLEPERPDPARWAKTEEAVLRKPLSEVQLEEPAFTPFPLEVAQSPPLSVLQPVFTPPLSQPSPVYGSPYGYAPALPPGIAMNQHGMPYELATGRPVYLQAPPPPMYNPRPIMPSQLQPSSVPFVPGHIHHHSAVSAISPDFLAQSAPQTPPMNGFIDPVTGTPIFSFPRQTSRIEIRAPSENGDGGTGSEVKSPGGGAKLSSHRPSGLRTTATAFEPSRSTSDDSSVGGYFPSLASLPSYATIDGGDGGVVNGDVQAYQHEQATLAYPQYPQYYYPDAYGAYPYVDVSQMGQYEMYPQDGVTPQGTVYY